MSIFSIRFADKNLGVRSITGIGISGRHVAVKCEGENSVVHAFKTNKDAKRCYDQIQQSREFLTLTDVGGMSFDPNDFV